MPTLTSFAEISLLLAMASVIGLVGMLLRQPLIVAFIAVGLIAGPSALNHTREGSIAATVAGPGPLRTWLRNAADGLSSDKGAARGNFPARRAF